MSILIFTLENRDPTIRMGVAPESHAWMAIEAENGAQDTEKERR